MIGVSSSLAKYTEWRKPDQCLEIVYDLYLKFVSGDDHKIKICE